MQWHSCEIVNLQALSQPRQWLGHVAGEPKVASRAIHKHIPKKKMLDLQVTSRHHRYPLDPFRLLTAWILQGHIRKARRLQRGCAIIGTCHQAMADQI